MPTAQVRPEWETEDVQVKEWREAEDHPAIWSETKSESPDDARTEHPKLDIYHDLKAEIDQAGRILTLEDDWDGEGSLGYSRDTLDRAIAFLAIHMSCLWESYGIRSPIPRISPGPYGSIDLHWKQPSWELLVNIPADPNEMAVFYGDNYGAQKIRGSLGQAKVNLGIAAWLMN